ncbi:GntR family transcriptional regulator [Primorskyibacter sedentarius]|uniref:GntR family transcriptional regulator n=1 Tax=Primorskyibacter sedentarius TaxID=745311 RepID=A0A4R3JJB5_9RHOB|nr:GntR family transcriptional regulator [Primorskyibacter sedentarius]TCS66333.1 GntR family transcriptional regulator [Primorskyibacter sedentarius]
MAQARPVPEGRTSADEVFEALYHDIVTLKLMPGRKISEAEVASQFSVSRQPVRDAFSRLGNLGLLLIRPQKATVVRKFSAPEIANARFVRTAIEVEVLRAAQANWPKIDTTGFQDNIEQQAAAIEAKDSDLFHELDYEFHKMLCAASGLELAFETIAEMKTKVDRLCLLSLEENAEMDVLLDDHKTIIAALGGADFAPVEAAIRKHLSRLDSVVDKIQREHGGYFE